MLSRDRIRAFLEEGPEELRPLREEIAKLDYAAIDAFETFVECSRILNEELRDRNRSDVAARVRTRKAAASALVNELHARRFELMCAYREELRRLEVDEYPESVREEAARLMAERDEQVKRALEHRGRRLDPGDFIAPLWQYGFALIRNDENRIAKAKSHLDESAQRLDSIISDRKDRLRAVEEHYAARLAELKEAQ